MKRSLFLFCVTLLLAVFVPSAESGKFLYSNKDFLKSPTILTQSTEVAALGRVADLGDLYDARTDNFVEISLYTTDLSGDAIHSTDNAYSAIDYVRTESFSEKMEKLGVQAGLAASFLGGMVSVRGSGKYLNEDKKSAKSAKISLIYSIRTVREDLKIFTNTSRSLINTFLLENIDATHIVVGIEWGANVVLSLEETNTDSSSTEEIQGELEAALNIAVLSVSGSADVDFGSSNVEKSSTFSLHLNGDIIPNTVPQTINESIVFIRDIPNLIKNENNGKGKIMNYILMPLSTVQKVFQSQVDVSTIVKDINQELVDQFMEIFQEMKDSELEINDAYNSFNKWKLMAPESELEIISEVKSKFESFSNGLKGQFSDLVVQFRNGDLDDEALSDLITSYRNSNWTNADINKQLGILEPTMQKIRLLNLFQSFNAKFIDRKTNKNQILWDNYQEEIKIISVDLGRMDISSPYVRDIVRSLKAESGKESGAIKYYIEDIAIAIPEAKAYLEGIVINSFPIDKKEYVFLKIDVGKIIIIDAKSFEQVITCDVPEISITTIAIVNDTLYSIDPEEGMIMSTGVKNILNRCDDINWTQVGWLSPGSWISNAAVVNGSFIYFVTFEGVLYLYDTTFKTVTKMELIPSVNYDINYAYLVVIDGILYFQSGTNLYSFDGTTLKEITIPDDREHSGLMPFEGLVCRVGGWNSNNHDMISDVSCYDPTDGSWNVTSVINESRLCPGITVTESGIYVFGGGTNDYRDSWLFSAEVFNSKTKTWSYIPSPLTNESSFVQAVTFYF